MEKGLLALAVSMLIVLSPISFAYELKTTNTDPLEPLVSALLEIQYKITGFAIIKISDNLDTDTSVVTKTIQEAQAKVDESIQSSNIFESYTYIYFGSKVIEKISATNDVYFHSDHLGSTRLVTDSSGNRISENSYEPFGSDQSSSKDKIKFTGKEEDSSNLYYYGTRYYDPEFGRFTQIDPIYDSLQTPYAYVGNNPIMYVDPDGKFFFVPPAVYGAAAALTAYGQAAMSDPSFVQDTHDFTDAWKEKDWWVLSFAVLGMAAQGGSGRGIREGVDEGAKKIKVWVNKLNMIVKEGEGTPVEVTEETYDLMRKFSPAFDKVGTNFKQKIGVIRSLDKESGDGGRLAHDIISDRNLGQFVKSKYSDIAMDRMRRIVATLPRVRSSSIPLAKGETLAEYGITDSQRALLEQLFDPHSILNINNKRGTSSKKVNSALSALRVQLKKNYPHIDQEFFK